MLHQRSRSFSAAYAAKPQPLRSLSIFAPHQVKNISVFILEERLPAGSPLANFKDFPWRKVYVTHNVNDALHMADVGQFDVAMLDASVGGKDTSEVALFISKKGIPIVICTRSFSQGKPLGFDKALILQHPSPGEKLRATLQITDPNRQT